MSVERNAANRAARWASLALVALCLVILAVFAGWAAFGQQPEPTPTPTNPGWIKWLDRELVPAVHFLGENPVILALGLVVVAYFLYLCFAVPVVWTIKSKYNGDRTKCSFRVLLVWNILEFTALSPWIMLGRTARHYWPVSFKPWESDTADEKAPPGDG